MEWNFSQCPFDTGWYAVLICYDENEGVFPSAGYWDGSKWDRKAVIGYGDKCETEDQANALAYKNDPDA